MSKAVLPVFYQFPSQAIIYEKLKSFSLNIKEQEAVIKKTASLFASKKMHEKGIEHNVLTILREELKYTDLALHPFKINLTNALKQLANGKKISIERVEEKGESPAGSRSPSSSPKAEVSQDDIALQESS